MIFLGSTPVAVVEILVQCIEILTECSFNVNGLAVGGAKRVQQIQISESGNNKRLCKIISAKPATVNNTTANISAPVTDKRRRRLSSSLLTSCSTSCHRIVWFPGAATGPEHYG